MVLSFYHPMIWNFDFVDIGCFCVLDSAAMSCLQSLSFSRQKIIYCIIADFQWCSARSHLKPMLWVTENMTLWDRCYCYLARSYKLILSLKIIEERCNLITRSAGNQSKHAKQLLQLVARILFFLNVSKDQRISMDAHTDRSCLGIAPLNLPR